MTARSNAIYAAVLACIVAGCSQDGTLSSPFNTGAIDPQKQQANAQAAKSTEALCLTLASQIDALNTEGIPDKVAKAAAKKYKLKPTDITKADELNKANTELQTKCSSYPPRVTTATAPVEPVSATPTTPGAPQKTAAKTKPPVPSQKPIAAAMAPQETTAAAATPAGDPTSPSP